MKKVLCKFGRLVGKSACLSAAAVAILALAGPLGSLSLAGGGDPGDLRTVAVPMPADLDQFIVNMDMARALGKALFWDMQVGGDGRTACATCHFHAGTDARPRNTIGVRGSQFQNHVANQKLTAADFPFHRLADPADRNSAVVFDSTDVVGGQGVIKRLFKALNLPSPVDKAQTVPDPIFNVDGINTRQVTGRNTPTNFNAVFNDRQFWDGRANRFFNGVNPFGEFDPSARVWKFDGGSLQQVHLQIANASLASQAVGPPNNNVEMSWDGRTFPELGRKMLSLRPLNLQRVHPNDSVLGPSARAGMKGLSFKTYSEMVRQAFRPEWWDSPSTVDGQFTQMEANFSLFWGLSVNVFEALLVSDDSPFDRFARGDQSALTAQQRRGLTTFTGAGHCSKCHPGPELTNASVSHIAATGVTALDNLAAGGQAFFDTGFMNIGVRPTANDLGNGRMDLPVGTISYSRRAHPGERLAVDGAMKTPGLRNVELTGPFFHNGGESTLTQVVEFYARGTDFGDQNIDNLAANVSGVGKIVGRADRIAEVVAFLESLTDERVRHERAPFDHPEIIVPNGHSGFKKGAAVDRNVTIPAVGADGGAAVRSFEDILNGAGLAP